jgi:ABC-type Na+ efflux pump, permease component
VSGIFTIAAREVRSVMREKTIVLAILIQLLIASMSSLLLMGLISYYDPSSLDEQANIHIRIGITGDINGPLAEHLEEDQLFVVYRFASAENALEAYKGGSIDAILNIPDEEDDLVNVVLYLPPSDSRSSVILMALKEPLKDYENDLRIERGVVTQFSDVEGKPNTVHEFIYTLVLPMLMLFPGFLAGGIVIDSLAEELENHTLDTLLAAPVSLNGIIAGKVLVAVAIAMVQCILWPLLLEMNGIEVRQLVQVWYVALCAAAFIAAGTAIVTVLLKDRERSQLLYSVGLMVAAGVTALADPSPVNMLARLALGTASMDIAGIIAYAAPAILLGGALYFVSRRMMTARL